MIQFNLLPDVKLEFIKATYKRRVTTIICFMTAGGFLTIFLLMFLFVRVNQTSHLKNLDEDIKKSVAELRDQNPELDKVLTIQNQLNSLPSLHNEKVMSSRIFDYLTQVTPSQARVTNVEMDLDGLNITIKGTTDSIPTLNKFVDTLKFTEFTVSGENGSSGKAFNQVVLQNFRIDPAAANGAGAENSVSYQIEFSYDEAIFANTAREGSAVANAVKLTVPSIISTRSETQTPNELFENTREQPASEAN